MRGVGVATAALGVVLMASLLLVLPDAAPLLRWSGPVGLLVLAGVAGFWRPSVEVADGGVTLRNPLRTVLVPWPAIEAVDGRLGLQLDTAWGRYSGWAATAPSGRQRLRGGESAVAGLVRERLDALRAAGHLDHAQVEFEAAPLRWHRGTLVVAALLVVVSGAGPVLAGLTG